ncbi:transketolase [Candidatus Pacearchaeota archaeon]|nr:transketolase [Candidatus Pacearchaeota archaeon]
MSGEELSIIANRLRRDSLLMTTAAGSGHASSCLSCAEIITTLLFHEMSYDPSNPGHPDNDEFILSKGHAAPILYAALFRAKCINEDLLSLRKLTSNLEGHPIPGAIPWIKVATGSLGQGLSAGVGMALAGKLKKRSFRTYVLLGDSELSEGSNYEALQLATHYSLHNLCAIVDVNGLGQRGATMLGTKIDAYKKRFESFGWKVFTADGHSIQSLMTAFSGAKASKTPSIILAKTVKGKGVALMEGKNGWHGKALTPEQLQKALLKFPEQDLPPVRIEVPEPSEEREKASDLVLSSYKEDISTREVYGRTLAEFSKSYDRIIAIDAEVSNSTFSEEVKKNTPKQFVEAYIAEQNMIGMALGLSKKGYKVFASSFSAFLTRAHDQLRMAAYSMGNFTVCGSHSGVSIGEDGASQMGLEDIALFRSLPNTIVLYPCDALSTQKLMLLSQTEQGIKYIRTTRPKTPLLYDPEDEFAIGDFGVVRESPKDKVVLVGAGITVHEAMKAHALLAEERVAAAVVDLYSIKPFNTKEFIEFVKGRGKKVVVAEDHYKEGGIGEMLCSELADTDIKITCLSVSEVPHSGTCEELLDKYGINAAAIVEAARKLL